ncbi:MAG: hypothetical protein IPN77_28265 [Sandaracinaceae bacterium]|nr:hypothetical protein [Sandaracinaceae bacterium]
MANHPEFWATLERRAPLTLLCSCALLVACGSDSPPPPDAGTDAEVVLDGGPTPDGGPEDAGTDAGVPDAGLTAPVVTSTAPTEATEEAAYSYAVTCTDPNGDAVMVAEGAADTCGGVVTGTTYAFTPTESQGGTSCVVAVECSDGTEMVPQTTTVTIAETNSPPTLTNLPDTVFTVHDLAGFFDVSATDPDLPAQTLTYGVGATTCAFAPTVAANRVGWTCGASVGSCTVDVTVIDPTNLSDTNQLTISCTNVAPQLTSTAPAVASEGTAYSYPVTCTDADGDTVTVSKAPEDTCGGTLAGTTYAFTPTEAQGGSTCVVAVQCTDGTETVSEGTTVTLAETNSPPVLTNLPATVPTIRERAGTFTLTASDPEPPPQVLAYSVGTHGCGFPVSVNATSGVLSWTCGSSVITCGVPITVTDPGSLTDSKLLTIECTNRDPELTSTMPAAASEHVLYTQPITCTDPDGHALALSTAAGNTCGALTASGGTGTYAFTPTEAQGGSTCVIAVSCSDGVGTVTQTTTVDIAETNTAPALSNLGAAVTTGRNTPGTFTATATDPDVPAQTLTFSLAATTCLFTPTVATGGLVSWTCGSAVSTCRVDVRVSDGSLSDTRQLTIGCVNAAPEITSTGGTTAAEGTPYTYAVTCTDADGDPVSISQGSGDTCGGTVTSTTYSFVPGETLGDSSCAVVIDCGDGLTTVSQTTTVAVAEVNTPPTLTNLPATVNAPLNLAGSFSATATDSDVPAQSLTFSLASTTCVFAPTVTAGGLVSWTCGSAVSTCAVDVRVSDGSLTDTRQLTIGCEE